MRWEGNRESDNVEDMRGDGGGGGGGGFGFGGRSIGIGTILIALVGSYFLGVSPSTILSLLSGGGPVAVQQQQPRSHSTDPNDRQAKFVRVVLADTEDTWDELFKQQGAQYVRPKLDLFTGRIPTACGQGLTATGPFYCPGDQKVYIDLSFYKLMEQRFGVSGEFAKAYVIAHEVGHHVQNLMGISEKVDNARRRASEKQANALSVRMELQADCFAGVWGYHCGATMPTARARSWNRAISKPRLPPLPQLATMRCSARPPVKWCRIPSPTAPPNSAYAGSHGASNRAILPSAIPSRPSNCK